MQQPDKAPSLLLVGCEGKSECLCTDVCSTEIAIWRSNREYIDTIPQVSSLIMMEGSEYRACTYLTS